MDPLILMMLLSPEAAAGAGAAAGAAGAAGGTAAGAAAGGAAAADPKAQAQAAADAAAADAADEGDADAAGDNAADDAAAAVDPGKIGASAISDFTKRHGFTPQEAKAILRQAKRAKAAAKSGGAGDDDADPAAGDAAGAAAGADAIKQATENAKRLTAQMQRERDEANAELSALVDEAYAAAPPEVVEMLEEVHDDLEEKSPKERKRLLQGAMKMHEKALAAVKGTQADADADPAAAAAAKKAAPKKAARGALPGHTPGTSSNEATKSSMTQLFEKARKGDKVARAEFLKMKAKHPDIIVGRTT